MLTRVLGVLGLSLLALSVTGCGSGESAPNADSVLPEVEGQDPADPDNKPGGKADSTGKDWPGNASLPSSCDLQRPLQVFFAPDDPTVTLELSLIDRVREARKTSNEAYAEGSNPYRIRYAVYNLTHAVITQRLVQAEADGVDVQVLIEADQLANPWVDSDDTFAQNGLEVVADYHTLTATSRVTADFIGIQEEGLMHLKTRLFETPQESYLLSGSLNPNGSAAANEETLHLIRDPALIARYAAGYDAVLEGKAHQNVWDDNAAVNVLHTPAAEGAVRASTRMLEWLDSETEQILLMVFSLREVRSPAFPKSLTAILAEKVAAGVPVYVITDRKQSDGIDLYGNKVAGDDWTEDRLRKAGVHVYEALNDAHELFGDSNAFAAMHHKVAVLGRTNLRVITDAANWTKAALGSNTLAPESNRETMLFIDSARLDGNFTGRRYLGQWFRVLERYGQQSADIDHELSYDQVVDNLMTSPSWPTESLVFTAEQAQTSYGEELFATGSTEPLGLWGQSHPGVQLSTDAKSYPTWHSTTPVDVRVATRFAYKFTARSSQGVRWEGGNDHIGRASPRVCTPPGQSTEIRARWQ